MALTLKSTARTAQGRLTVHFIGGHKTTDSVWCSRNEIQMNLGQLKSINYASGYHKVYWNGQILS